MAISDTGITSVELVNTFEDWRTKTNDIITVLNQNSDDNPASNLISANSIGGLEINTISANIVTGANVSGNRLLFSGGIIDFAGASTEDLGTVEKFALVEGAGATISGAAPDSKIERAQINECEINLNGATLRANGSSNIILTGATVSDLGTVSTATLNGGTINNMNVNITDDNTLQIITIEAAGPHLFEGATFDRGTYTIPTIVGGLHHSANISVNTASRLVTNTGPIFGSDVGTSNVAIGDFPEYSTSPTLATSSKGRLHIRSDFANPAGSGTATAVNGVADELVLENEDDVGMTLLSDTASNAHIMFGDTDDQKRGSIIYDHDTDSMHVVTDGANTAVFANEYGGSLQIVGGDTYSAAGQAGKLHVNVGSTDGVTGIYLDLNDADQQGIRVDANTDPGCSTNVFELRANTTSGHAMTLAHGLVTGTSHAMSGSMLAITDNNSSTTTRAIVDINQDSTYATGTIGLKVKTDAGIGISVVQNKDDKTGINVEGSGATIKVKTDTGIGISVAQNADKTGINLHSTVAHSEPLLRLVSNYAGASAGQTFFLQSKTTTMATKIVQVANSSVDVFSALANGTINFGGPSILSSNSTSTVNCRLGVRDSGGTVVNTT